MRTVVRHTLIGCVIFITIVAGGTYYLQSSLLLVKQYGPYTHWAAVLVALPIIAGLVHRFTSIRYPLTNVICGSLISAAILYPQYKKLWAVPPSSADIVIYITIVFGIGYLATQSIRRTIMIAFCMGRYSIEKISAPAKPSSKSSRGTKKSSAASASTQPMHSHRGQTLAMVELAIGVCSLALSIFSVFFLGQA